MGEIQISPFFMIMNYFLSIFFLFFAALVGFGYIASIVRLPATGGAKRLFLASFFRVILGSSFFLFLLSLPLLTSILMGIVCIGAAITTLWFIRPA